MKSYKDLVAYQKGYKLALEIYQGTRNYPKEEIYGLVITDEKKRGFNPV